MHSVKFLLFLIISCLSVTTNEVVNSSSECPVPREKVPSTVKLKKRDVTALGDIKNIIFLETGKNSGIIEEGLSDFSPTTTGIMSSPEAVLDIREDLPQNVSGSSESSLEDEEPPVDPQVAESSQNETSLNSTEDSPMPVFSEWAQKQMQEAEQKQRLDEENGSVATTLRGTSKPNSLPVMKLRAKNYASPDCGAKILAANPEAQSTSSVLTASKDEYLLNPCTSRIWFVVELCEPVQAEKIDLANFELFSSSPKEFTVSVSNRFPTREWQTVGKFTAMDERTVQNFTLEPQLFGKFMRVEIHSHYNSEHYCPVSLFRVFGTSEFEAFETENQVFKIVEADDFEDDEEEALRKNGGTLKDDKNLLKVVGEAVGNIVKKAAEVLGKQPSNDTAKNQTQMTCQSLTSETQCGFCGEKLLSEVQLLVQCQREYLERLSSQRTVAESLAESQFCLNLLSSSKSCFPYTYVTSMLPLKTSVALCNYLEVLDFIQPSQAPPFSTEESQECLTISTEASSESSETQSQENFSTEGVVFEPMEVIHLPSDTQIPMPPPQEPLEPVLEVIPETQEREEPKFEGERKSEEREVADAWENLESLLGEAVGIETTTPPSTNGHGGNGAQKTQHSESVFLRLSNRIKSLERNMSLSGQYLEELSRRYKKQVEELQQSFTKTLSQIEEQNKRYMEREQHLFEQNIKLRHDLNELMDSLHNWKTIIVYVGGFVCVQVLMLFALVRHCSRRNAMLAEALEASLARKKKKNLLNRRKSMEVIQNSPTAERRRRPSEEALNISGHYEDLLIATGTPDERESEFVEVKAKRKKKDKSKSKLLKRGSSSGESTSELKRKEYANSGGSASLPLETGNNRIEEMPYLEDNDEFIIPTASELSYNEFVPPPEKLLNGVLDLSISDTSSKSSNTKLSRFSSPNIFASRRARKSSVPSGSETGSGGWDWLRRSSKASEKTKGKSESPENGDAKSLGSSTTSSKKKTGSFRRILKKVF